MNPPLTLATAAARIRAGKVSPVELVEQCLTQIDRHEDRIRAWVTVDREGALRTAREMEKRAAEGPLHGIPIGIKDIVDVEGFPTKAGSPLREDHLAEEDAPLVAALRRAGAIILGKTVTVEFACFDPSPTRNPWDPALKHTPGGSSSGSAAAVALGMCLGAIGTQTGGSLVRPSSYCGVATCKPTFGSLCIEGVVPVSYHLDHPGPMARTAADVERMLSCLMPIDTVDLSSAPRLGRIGNFFLTEAETSVRETIERAVARFADAGAHVENVVFDEGFEQVRPMHRRIMAVEAAAYHRERFTKHREAYGPMIRGLLDEGLTISGIDYADALAWQRKYRRHVERLLKGVDALVVPSTDTTAPATLDTTGTPKFQAPWSCAGVPVVSIPCGLSSSDRMPVGLQLVGPPGAEARLLATARWCEGHLEPIGTPPIS